MKKIFYLLLITLVLATTVLLTACANKSKVSEQINNTLGVSISENRFDESQQFLSLIPMDNFQQEKLGTYLISKNDYVAVLVHFPKGSYIFRIPIKYAVINYDNYNPRISLSSAQIFRFYQYLLNKQQFIINQSVYIFIPNPLS